MSLKPERPEALLARSMRAAGLVDFRVAAVLGSGLGDFADRLADRRVVPFTDLEGMPQSTVPGHSGQFVLGTLGGERILIQQGRVHLYEGHSAQVVTLAVRAMGLLGCRVLLLTNAAGGLVSDWPVPSLMRIRDHLNLQGVAPLRREEMGSGSPYDPAAGDILEQAAAEVDVPLRSGVYAGLLGPSYETAAEIQLLGQMGAQAVGMSTVAEAVTGAAIGMRVTALSLISNPAAGIAKGPLNHEEVTQAGRDYAEHFARLLELGLPRLAGLDL
ncbi:MAG TPA: purine-nucleoside phosphorylase [Planctomycetota bacterium]|nr:purine-nucleoside phosphorylase [Planctomycetota bacterium]